MHHHHVSIYYEDTDLSGVVYHANYLKYFERAREHMIGRPELVRMWEQDGVGFVVYKAEMTFKRGAKLGDELDIRTVVEKTSPWRLRFEHSVWREGDTEALVEGIIEMVCVNQDQKLIKLPASLELTLS